MSQADQDTFERIFDWLKKHKRADAAPGMPMQGFGENERYPYTLWLPEAQRPTRYRRINGRFKSVVVPSVLTTPAMLTLQRRAMQSLKVVDGVAKCGTAFLDYASAVIRTSYSVTDEELEMLLSGTGWHRPMLIHLAGGEQAIRLIHGQRKAVA